MSEPLPEAFSTAIAIVKPERASPELPAESSTPAPSIPLADSSSTQRQAEDALPSAQDTLQEPADDRTSATSPSPEVNEREGSAYEEEGDMALDQDDEYEDDSALSDDSEKPRKKGRRPRQIWSAAEDAALWRVKKRLRGPDVPLEEAKRYDWSTLLGPDHFPETKRTLSSAKLRPTPRQAGPRASYPPTLTSQREHTQHDLSSSRPTPSLPHLYNVSEAIASAQMFSSGSASFAASPYAHTQVAGQLTILPAFTPRSYIPINSQHQQTSPFLNELSCLLSPFVACRDLTSFVRALFACGVTGIDVLTDLLLLDDGILDSFLDLVGKQKKLGGVQLAFGKKALQAMRECLGPTE
ncbi:hypothetical protein AAT19DRAFT_15637 [Rhodotorula toruloides]|uniref:Uncharacterized protein n=1 Tax=Rhodotorula toruloides TaxID=5286 RepID=A0A2T0A7T4_RHOTO|nr:hypothetical protein AAT19DRAFT_15637 [Rhodotorula toruloides]